MKLDDAAFDAAAFDAFCRDLFPARGGGASYEYVSCEVGVPPWGYKRESVLSLTVRLLTYDTAANGDIAIRDIKEQQVAFARASEDVERVKAYLAAFVDVLARAFEAAGVDISAWETLMPHDFAHADVLSLKTAHNKDDFVKAFERPSRFGRWLARGQPAAAAADAALPAEDALAPPSPVDDDKSL